MTEIEAYVAEIRVGPMQGLIISDIILGVEVDPINFDLWFFYFCCRGVAQLASALVWGTRGRRFESSHPDHARVVPASCPGGVMTEVRSGAFNELIAQPDTHVALDLSGDARSLLVLFGGIAGGVSMPVFEFFRLTAGMPGKKAFLRDPRRGWYQLGLPGVGPTAQDVRRYLDDVIASARVDRVVMAGASAGGYAAMLFGAWCGADEVLAFSPQTFIDAANRRAAGDDRWSPQIDHLHAVNPPEAVYDLRDVVESTSTPRISLHVSSDDALDLVHTHHVADLPGVTITVHDQGGHRLVKTLRDRGILAPLLQGALRLPPP